MIHDMIMAAAGAAGPSGPTDADFENVTLLLHGDGTNGAQNNTFLDSSTNNFTITRNGNTTQGSFSPFSKPDGRWGTYYDGTDDYLSVADNAVLRPGAGAFTLEAWVYRNAAGAAHTIYAKGGASTGISFLITSGDVLRFTHTTTNIDSSGTVAANAWVHVAVVREGTGTNQTKLYINGTQDGQGTVSTDFTQTEEVRIGTNRGATDDFAGYISNVRFVKGSALYTGNFTPSTSPFTTTSQGASSSEVELLTCQSNRFKDNSSNNFTITRNGDVRVTPFSPFPTLTAYDAATNGGSGYFDGSGDYLSVPQNNAFAFETGDFTVEAWIYLTGNSAQQLNGNRTATIVSTQSDNTGWDLFLGGDTTTTGTGLVFSNRINSNLAYTLSVTITINQQTWNHVAVVRSGTTTTMYLNGVDVGSTTLTEQNISIDKDLWIAKNGFTGFSKEFPGYISGLKVIKGTATAPSGIPTTPPVDSSGTSLLCNFTNAGIIDNSMSNNLETVGNAQIDTTTKKYGTGSMEFDGTGDGLVMPSAPDVRFGSGDFTIEGWLRSNSIATTQIVLERRESFNARGIAIFLDNSLLGFRAGDTDNVGGWEVAIDSGTLSSNTWYHFALTRSGSTWRGFVDGTQVGSSVTWSGTIADETSNLLIGISLNGTAGLNGYIDDLRITKGKARYTTTFTPPTAALPDIGE